MTQIKTFSKIDVQERVLRTILTKVTSRLRKRQNTRGSRDFGSFFSYLKKKVVRSTLHGICRLIVSISLTFIEPTFFILGQFGTVRGTSIEFGINFVKCTVYLDVFGEKCGNQALKVIYLLFSIVHIFGPQPWLSLPPSISVHCTLHFLYLSAS